MALNNIRASLAMRLEAAGISIGPDQSCDVIVHDNSVYEEIAFRATLGIGETFVDRKWECKNSQQLRDVLARGIQAGVPIGSLNLPYYILQLHHKLFNLQSAEKAREIAKHYDIDISLYKRQLGADMSYTGAYFGRGATTLEDAQRDKKKLICEKLYLEQGHKVLDIGCGFGSFARFAAEEYGAHVTGITISDEQLSYGRNFCRGFDDVELLLMNYLDLLEKFEPHSFDRIASIGMFEHVGPKNYERYMKIVRTLLKPDGLFLLHTIIGDGFDPWINKYIFPGGVLPREDQIAFAARNQNFVIEDWHNFGADYSRTLSMWRKNFEDAWPELQLSGKFGNTLEERERFYRKWIFYLAVTDAGFLARSTQLGQIVLSPHGVPGGYISVR